MPSPLTERAIKIINAVQPPKHGPLQTLEYAKRLPQEAEPLARFLRDKSMVDLGDKYLHYDGRAMKSQRRYFWPRIIGLVALFFSVLLTGFSVYASTSNNQALIDAVRPYLAPAQWTLLLILLVCAVCAAIVYRSSTAKSMWAVARSEAESYRASFYKELMSAPGTGGDGDGGIWQKSLRLECFRRHLLDDQRAYFAARNKTYHRYRFFGKAISIVAVVLIGAASVPQMVASLSALSPLEKLPDGLRYVIELLVWDRKLYALAWIYGSALQLVIARLAFISPVVNHGEKYGMIGAVLSALANRLPDAREAAATPGATEPVTWFARGIQDTLEAERGLWNDQELGK
jgi:hypothetical protein